MPDRHQTSALALFLSVFAVAVSLALAIGSRPALAAPLDSPRSVPKTFRSQDASPTVADLDVMVRTKRYIELGAALNGNTKLTPNEKDYFQGIYDSHVNAVDSSVRLLDRLLPGLREAKSWEHLSTALRALAEDYARRFNYGKAADTYTALEQALDQQATHGLSVGGRRQIRDDVARYDLLRGQLPQTVEPFRGTDEVQGHRNPFGLLEVPLSVGDATTTPAESWVVDTGSSLSAVTRSTAARLHLKLISGKATTLGVGGGEIPLQVAVIPVLRLGKTVVRNAAVVVFEDQALNLGAPPYQIQGILGFPILEAMGRITFGPHDRIVVGGPATAQPGPSNLYFDNFKPIVAGITDAGPRLFTFDSGATDTVLTELYEREHRADLSNDPQVDYRFTGADGAKAVPARQAPLVKLDIGGAIVALVRVPVLMDQAGHPSANVFFGNLGQDMLRDFSSYTLDFRAMRFTLER